MSRDNLINFAELIARRSQGREPVKASTDRGMDQDILGNLIPDVSHSAVEVTPEGAVQEGAIAITDRSDRNNPEEVVQEN